MNTSFTNHKEPETKFVPLTAKRYAELYSIEMDTFNDDINFYRKHCKKKSTILELGCGTGRIMKSNVFSDCHIIGLDISLAMLQCAVQNSIKSLSCVCMDMTVMAFTTQFDHIIIPYNTINLLRDKQIITSCLRLAKRYLDSKGSLLLQLYIPDNELMLNSGKNRFQFQIFNQRDKNGKIIKETFYSYDNLHQEIRLEERYRIRPNNQGEAKEDLSHIHHLAGFPVESWLEILQACGFSSISLYGGDGSRLFNDGSDSTLLLKASVL